MPVDRTAHAALVDSNGTPGHGSPWDKAAIAAVLLDPIDSVAMPNIQVTTLAGTQTDFALTKRYTSLRCNNATPLELTGFKVNGVQPLEGDRIFIENIATSTVKVNHQSGGTATMRVICPSTNGQIIGVGGRMLLVYDATTTRWRESLLDPGGMIDVAYAAGSFTAEGAMTWTVESGDQITYKFMQRGTMLTVVAVIGTSSVGGTPNDAIKIAVPGGFTIADAGGGEIIRIINAGTEEHGMIDFSAAGTLFRIYRPAAANWSAATNTTWVYLSTEIEVQ